MEARFQQYRGKVQLVYMYVREAHPNPDTAPCGSTRELGWAHPSDVTLSRAERKHVSVVAAAAHTRGSGGSQWVTDLTIANPGDVETAVTTHVQSWKDDSANPEPRSWTLEAWQTIEMLDVFASEFSIEGNATLRLESEQPVVAVSRTYNDTPDGTFGQLVPGLDISSDRVLRPGWIGHLLQLEESGNEGRRTNLGLVNAEATPADMNRCQEKLS